MKESENGTGISSAPWEIEQVWALNEHQNNRNGYNWPIVEAKHPYTCSCGNDLLAVTPGWWCETCRKITQTWAHEADTVIDND